MPIKKSDAGQEMLLNILDNIQNSQRELSAQMNHQTETTAKLSERLTSLSNKLDDQSVTLIGHRETLAGNLESQRILLAESLEDQRILSAKNLEASLSVLTSSITKLSERVDVHDEEIRSLEDSRTGVKYVWVALTALFSSVFGGILTWLKFHGKF